MMTRLNDKVNGVLMIRPMFGRQKKPKKFDMPLRYYNPKEEERRRRRIRIQPTTRRRDRGQNVRVLLYAAGLAVVIYIISVL
ncbi:MAG: hypothetical protein WD028_01395 [Balneolaceae bacterium]